MDSTWCQVEKMEKVMINMTTTDKGTWLMKNKDLTNEKGRWGKGIELRWLYLHGFGVEIIFKLGWRIQTLRRWKGKLGHLLVMPNKYLLWKAASLASHTFQAIHYRPRMCYRLITIIVAKEVLRLKEVKGIEFGGKRWSIPNEDRDTVNVNNSLFHSGAVCTTILLQVGIWIELI